MVKIALLIIAMLICSCENWTKKTVIVSLRSNIFPERLNPAQTDKYLEDVIYSQIYETLFKINPDRQTILPNLALEWKFSEDKLKLHLQLRKNVYFHDNTKFSAYSVKKSYEWIISEYASSPLLNMIETIEVLDSLAVNILLKYPYSQILFNLASPFGLNIISEAAIEKYKKDLEFHPIGTGPFYLQEWEKLKKIQLHSFNKYWHIKGEVKRIIFKSFAEKFGSENALRDEIADLTFPVTGSITDRLKQTGLIDYKINPPINIIYLGFNNNQPPFNNEKVRKAVSQSIRIKKLVYYIVSGNAIVAKGPITPDLIQYGNMKQDEYNLQNAKRLLQEAGYENGLSIRFYFPKVSATRLTIIEFIISELSKIGITLDVTFFDTWEDFLIAVKSDSSQMFFDACGNNLVGDAGSILYSLFSSKSEDNLAQYNNHIVDNLLDKAKVEYDFNHRRQIYQKIVKEILNDTPAVFLYHMKQHYAYNKHRIKYLPVNPYGAIEFNRIILND